MISRTAPGFWKAYEGLPQDIRAAADRVYRLWREEAGHPSLRFKRVSERHDVWSIRIGIHWRALGYRRRDEAGQFAVTWFWIGSHAEYDRMVASL